MHVREPLRGVEQLGVGDVAGLAVLADPVVGDLVAACRRRRGGRGSCGRRSTCPPGTTWPTARPTRARSARARTSRAPSPSAPTTPRNRSRPRRRWRIGEVRLLDELGGGLEALLLLQEDLEVDLVSHSRSFRSPRMPCAGSGVPNTAEPATNMLAPRRRSAARCGIDAAIDLDRDLGRQQRFRRARSSRSSAR
jgi:hypothetical protein